SKDQQCDLEKFASHTFLLVFLDVQKAYLARVLYSNGVPVACVSQLSESFEDEEMCRILRMKKVSIFGNQLSQMRTRHFHFERQIPRRQPVLSFSIASPFVSQEIPKATTASDSSQNTGLSSSKPFSAPSGSIL